VDASFYRKGCLVDGVPVVGSAEVDSRAIGQAARIAVNMLANRPDIWQALAGRGLRIGVIGTDQQAVDLPEYRDLPARFPGINWSGARAYSATLARPLLAGPEENLICSPRDTYPGQQVLVHELGHTAMDLGIRYLDRSFWPRVETAFANAKAKGLWTGFYGGTVATEYWAEGVQAYFDAARATGPGLAGSPISSRADLASYDPELYGLVREVFGDNAWRASCG
jgi:alpha-glucosidase